MGNVQRARCTTIEYLKLKWACEVPSWTTVKEEPEEGGKKGADVGDISPFDNLGRGPGRSSLSRGKVAPKVHVRLRGLRLYANELFILGLRG